MIIIHRLEELIVKLALFDFDGTISTKDSFMEFTKFSVGLPRFILSFFILSPLFVLYFLKLFPNHKLKEIFITYHFKNWSEKKFSDIADQYSRESLPQIIKNDALEKIRWHQQNNHDIYVVSASIEQWLKEWCNTHNLKLIATQLEISDGKITGKLAGTNCYGPEKVNRIQQHLNLSDYEHIYAYGDSGGDKEMLQIANEPFYRNFVK